MDILKSGQKIDYDQCVNLLESWRDIDTERLFALARETSVRVYGREVFLRDLIEISNYCRNDCLYCGIRKSNKKAERYRLTDGQILGSCERGYELGLRTFVLQAGEDALFTDERLCGLISEIKSRWPDAAVTLSLGERPDESYAALRKAGADRYLLRHETADAEHYAALHPKEMSFENRRRSLSKLKELGFQVGAGFMVGSPGQTPGTLAKDLMFLQELRPHMVGIGPFIPHRDTPFFAESPGSAELTLVMLALVRLMLPQALLPATTALGSIAGGGLERGVLAGANVIMPNLTPPAQRVNYQLYDGKNAATDDQVISRRMEAIGYSASFTRGDHADVSGVKAKGEDLF